MTAEPVKQPTPSKDDRPTPAPPMRTLASYHPRVRRVISNLRNL